MSEVKRALVRRSYWSGQHSPYPWMEHDPDTDKRLAMDGHDGVIPTLMREAGIEDGDEFELVLRPTGRRPFDGTIWALTRPHHYEAVPADSRFGPTPEVGEVSGE